MKKRILLMIPTPPPYMGPSVATLVILNSNLKENFHLILLDTADRRSLKTLGKFDFFNIFHFFKQFFLLLHKNLFFKIDLNYLLLTQTKIGILRDFIFFLLIKILHKKVIFHFRGSGIFDLYERSGKIIKFFIKKIFLSSDGIILLCKRLKDIAEEKFPEGKYFVLFNGMEIPQIKREDKKLKNILFLSNLKEEKGFYDVIKIIPDILREYRDVKFIFGGGKLFDEEKIRGILKKYEKNIEIHISPKGKEKENLFKRSQLFLLPSYNEGMPWAIIEALGYSLPVISTDVGCIPEMVLDSENGFLIKPGDKDGLKERILKFLRGDVNFRECGKISREIYEKKFNERVFIDGLKKIFEEVLNENTSFKL